MAEEYPELHFGFFLSILNFNFTKPDANLVQTGVIRTERKDLWWIRPLVVFIVLTSFVIYVTWAALQGEHYAAGPYLSPLYSPEIFGSSAHSWLGPKPGWWPAIIPFSPALLILWAPGLFRFTCYYYRGAYYRAFWLDPPACGVPEPRKTYRGENSFPLIMQNIHRYFLYLALLFLVFLSYDAWKAMWFTDAVTGETTFGIGVGTVVITANTILLGVYTLSCHSFRHMVGGFRDLLSRSPVQQKAYHCASCLNRRHMSWAWFSLFSVAFADIYIRLVSMGVWTDYRLL